MSHNLIWIYWTPSTAEDFSGWYQARKQGSEYIYTKKWIKKGTKTVKNNSQDENEPHGGRLVEVTNANLGKRDGDYMTTQPYANKRKQRSPQQPQAPQAPPQAPPKKMKKQRKNVILMLQSKYDPNGAFDDGDEGLIALLSKLDEFDFRYTKVGSVQEIQQQMDLVRAEGRKIAHLIIMAHGSENSMALSRTNHIVLNRKSYNDFVMAMRGVLEDDSSVLLHSCEVGKNPDNFAVALARDFPGITFWGATDSIARGDLLVRYLKPDKDAKVLDIGYEIDPYRKYYYIIPYVIERRQKGGASTQGRPRHRKKKWITVRI